MSRRLTEKGEAHGEIIENQGFLQNKKSVTEAHGEREAHGGTIEIRSLCGIKKVSQRLTGKKEAHREIKKLNSVSLRLLCEPL